MLINTFLHLPGVGEKTEQRVWASGIHCWADALLAASTHPSWRPLLEQDIIRRYLVKCLVILNHAADLDIETAGRSLKHSLL